MCDESAVNADKITSLRAHVWSDISEISNISNSVEQELVQIPIYEAVTYNDVSGKSTTLPLISSTCIKNTGITSTVSTLNKPMPSWQQCVTAALGSRKHLSFNPDINVFKFNSNNLIDRNRGLTGEQQMSSCLSTHSGNFVVEECQMPQNKIIYEERQMPQNNNNGECQMPRIRFASCEGWQIPCLQMHTSSYVDVPDSQSILFQDDLYSSSNNVPQSADFDNVFMRILISWL